MTREQYDQIVDAFELAGKLNDREGNWEEYKEAEPRELILDMSASVLVDNLEWVAPGVEAGSLRQLMNYHHRRN